MLIKRAQDELTGRIRDDAVLRSFNDLICGMDALGLFELRPNINGQKKAIHFASGRVSYYAVVTNNRWLLWYFRRPGFRDGLWTWRDLEKRFPMLDRSQRRDPEKAEGILRLKSPTDVVPVIAFVSETQPPPPRA